MALSCDIHFSTGRPRKPETLIKQIAFGSDWSTNALHSNFEHENSLVRFWGACWQCPSDMGSLQTSSQLFNRQRCVMCPRPLAETIPGTERWCLTLLISSWDAFSAYISYRRSRTGLKCTAKMPTVHEMSSDLFPFCVHIHVFRTNAQISIQTPSSTDAENQQLCVGAQLVQQLLSATGLNKPTAAEPLCRKKHLSMAWQHWRRLHKLCTK